MTETQQLQAEYATRLFETKRRLESLVSTLNENGSEPCNADSDFLFSINVEYQNFFGKDEDDWDIDREAEAEYLNSLKA